MNLGLLPLNYKRSGSAKRRQVAWGLLTVGGGAEGSCSVQRLLFVTSERLLDIFLFFGPLYFTNFKSQVTTEVLPGISVWQKYMFLIEKNQ